MNVVMLTYQSEDAAKQLFNPNPNPPPTRRAMQILQKGMQALAGGSHFKVQQIQIMSSLSIFKCASHKIFEDLF